MAEKTTFPENFSAEFEIPFWPDGNGNYSGTLKYTSTLTPEQATKTIADVLCIDLSKIQITKTA
jgi:hypothetical protein